MPKRKFNEAVAALLLEHFPALETDEDMNGADTVDMLAELYGEAKRGELEVQP